MTIIPNLVARNRIQLQAPASAVVLIEFIRKCGSTAPWTDLNLTKGLRTKHPSYTIRRKDVVSGTRALGEEFSIHSRCQMR